MELTSKILKVLRTTQMTIGILILRIHPQNLMKETIVTIKLQLQEAGQGRVVNGNIPGKRIKFVNH